MQTNKQTAAQTTQLSRLWDCEMHPARINTGIYFYSQFNCVTVRRNSSWCEFGTTV